MSDTNVGLGMVPHRKGCDCDECRIERLQRDLSAARRELAQARGEALEEAAKRCDSYSDTGREMAAWAKNDSERASSYSLQALAAQSCAESIRALKPSPARGEQNNATGYQHKPQHYPTAPNAVPDDPVAFYCRYCGGITEDEMFADRKAIRALAAHYLHRAPEGYALVPKGLLTAAALVVQQVHGDCPNTQRLWAILTAAKQEADR